MGSPTWRITFSSNFIRSLKNVLLKVCLNLYLSVALKWKIRTIWANCSLRKCPNRLDKKALNIRVRNCQTKKIQIKDFELGWTLWGKISRNHQLIIASDSRSPRNHSTSQAITFQRRTCWRRKNLNIIVLRLGQSFSRQATFTRSDWNQTRIIISPAKHRKSV